MSDRIVNEVSTILQKPLYDVQNFEQKYKWINFNHLYYKLNKDCLLKIVPIEENSTYSEDDSIFTEAQFLLNNYDLNFCIFFYCFISNGVIKKYTMNSLKIVKNFKECIYKQYIHYQTNNIKQIEKSICRKRTRLQTKNATFLIPKINIDSQIESRIDNRKFISASKLKNFVFEDTLCDWLDEFYSNYNSNSNYNFNQDQNCEIIYPKFVNEVFENGIQFEKQIVDQIKHMFPNQYITISTSGFESLEIKKFYETILAMKNGVPIIFQGVLHNNIDNTFGIPDIIIRCDYINKLVPGTFHEKEKESILNKRHYRIIDIKSSKILLKANGKNILNNPLNRYYKTQLYVYNNALGIVQGYTPPIAYILSKSLQHKNNKYTSFKKLGIVDYENDDKYIINLYQKSISWIRYMRKNGKNWDPENPHILELYPNYKNKYDYKWKDYKSKLLINRSDILELWNCTTKHRLNAISKNITCWRTQQCTSIDLGFSQTKTSQILDLIININKEPQSMQLVWPDKIKNNYKNWQNKDAVELFLDFESITENEYIFMIGVGYDHNDNWTYNQYILDDLTEEAEKQMLINFFNFLNEFNNVKLFHWGNFEQSILEKKVKKYNLQACSNFILVDMLKIFKEEPIVVRGALNFSLKSIARAMYNNKLIETTWCNSLDGLEVSCMAKKIYKDSLDFNELDSISLYNEVDCKVLWEILNFMRNRII